MQKSAVHPCWCQTGIGFESGNQRASIVHGYICLIDVVSAAHIVKQILIFGFIQQWMDKIRPITVTQYKEGNVCTSVAMQRILM